MKQSFNRFIHNSNLKLAHKLLTYSGIPRTNNNIEGWHNGLNSFMGCQHPKFYKFLKYLIKEQDIQDLNIIQINAGEVPQKMRSKYERLDNRLFNLVSSYDEKTEKSFLPYLDAIAYNISV